MQRFISYLAVTAAMLSSFVVFAQEDVTLDSTGKKIKLPKHYFSKTVYADWYAIGPAGYILNEKDKNIDKEKELARKLGKYKYSQFVGGFYFPFKTVEKTHADGRVSNWHWLGTFNYMLAKPQFEHIADHNLVKMSLGVRAIYNSGRKNIWFIDMSPFISGDAGVAGTFAARWGTTVLYDRIVSQKFSFRVGYTRTFALGNRLHLPYVGFRIGRLDRIYFSAQFPRGMTFSFPLGSKWRGSLFTKPTGNLLTMGNTDTLYNGLTNHGRLDSTIIFGRYDGLTGLRVDYNPSRNLSFYLELGTSNVRALAFFSRDYNPANGFKDNVQIFTPFFTGGLKGRGFVSFGLTVRFGKTRSVYNNFNMYEVFNTNTTIAPGDNTNNTGNGEIPNAEKIKNKKEATNLETRDVQDLIEAQDLYN